MRPAPRVPVYLEGQRLSHGLKGGFVKGEEEAEFLEYRKELRVVVMNVAMVEGGIVEEAVESLLSQALSRWDALPFQDQELPLSLLFMLGEALPVNSPSFPLFSLPPPMTM